MAKVRKQTRDPLSERRISLRGEQADVEQRFAELRRLREAVKAGLDPKVARLARRRILGQVTVRELAVAANASHPALLMLEDLPAYSLTTDRVLNWLQNVHDPTAYDVLKDVFLAALGNSVVCVPWDRREVERRIVA